MRIAIISDAWHPQINGVVTTLTQTCRALDAMGHRAEVFSPDRFRTWPCPGYPDVGLAFLCGPRLRPLLRAFRPDAIHLATEGPVGYAARRFCRHRGFAYTSSFHSYFPEYFKLRIGLPTTLSYAYLRWFHHRSRRVMVATESLACDLAGKGFRNLAAWSRGVDTDLFRPRPKDFLEGQRPIFMYAGRVAVEKNIEALLSLSLPGSRYVVGDGPQRPELEAKYPEVRFAGYRKGEEFARYLAAADVLVFPSRTDTFGLVMLEALACGVPVAAFPVQGPKDILGEDQTGVDAIELSEAPSCRHRPPLTPNPHPQPVTLPGEERGLGFPFTPRRESEARAAGPVGEKGLLRLNSATLRAGVLSEDLAQAALSALKLRPEDCRRHAENYSWEAATRQFIANLTPLGRPWEPD